MKIWAVVMATILILAIVALAFFAVFFPGQASVWTIEMPGGVKASATSVLLGFAFVLLVIFWLVWPTFKKLIEEVYTAVQQAFTQFLD